MLKLPLLLPWYKITAFGLEAFAPLPRFPVDQMRLAEVLVVSNVPVDHFLQFTHLKLTWNMPPVFFVPVSVSVVIDVAVYAIGMTSPDAVRTDNVTLLLLFGVAMKKRDPAMYCPNPRPAYPTLEGPVIEIYRLFALAESLGTLMA